MSSFGITDNSMSLIKDTLLQWKEVEGASIFGSRALGNFKNGSDIDIVIYGSNVTAEIINRINVQLNEVLPIPYYIDVVHYESLSSESLKSHIDDMQNLLSKTII